MLTGGSSSLNDGLKLSDEFTIDNLDLGYDLLIRISHKVTLASARMGDVECEILPPIYPTSCLNH